MITPTASLDSGTGEPIPISAPVSRGSSLACSPPAALDVFARDSGLPPLSVSDARWAGGAGAYLSSLGVVSIPPLPRRSP